MKFTYGHRVTSSFLLWLENRLLTNGEAFSNISGQYFYDVKDTFTNYNAYSIPFGPIAYDESVSNLQLFSGVYLDNTFVPTGDASGLLAINYKKGQIYFQSGVANNRLSGNFAVPDFDIKLTNKPEEELLFETTYEVRPKVGQTITGLQPNETRYPVIFVKPFGGRNQEFAMGGLEKDGYDFRLIVLADSQYKLDGAVSILKDQTRSIIPLITGINEMPFNSYGDFANGSYNYRALITGRANSDNSMWLEDVMVSSVGRRYTELTDINPAAFVALVDCRVEAYRVTRG
ncbi:MAG: hypothetical protein Q8O88_04965 [bacterium]|nr:hypothetical protein [bacterium]